MTHEPEPIEKIDTRRTVRTDDIARSLQLQADGRRGRSRTGTVRAGSVRGRRRRPGAVLCRGAVSSS